MAHVLAPSKSRRCSSSQPYSHCIARHQRCFATGSFTTFFRLPFLCLVVLLIASSQTPLTHNVFHFVNAVRSSRTTANNAQFAGEAGSAPLLDVVMKGGDLSSALSASSSSTSSNDKQPLVSNNEATVVAGGGVSPSLANRMNPNAPLAAAAAADDANTNNNRFAGLIPSILTIPDKVIDVVRQPQNSSATTTTKDATTLTSLESPTQIAADIVRQQEETELRPYSLDTLAHDLNQSQAQPCDNFFQYVCHGWIKHNPIPDDKSSFDTFAKLREDTRAKLKHVLDAPLNTTTADFNEFEVKSRNMYHACMDIDTINALGVQPLIDFFDGIGFTWPVIAHKQKTKDGSSAATLWPENSPNSTSFMWQEIITKLRQTGYDLLLSLGVGIDIRNSSRHVLIIDQTSLGRSREQLLKPINDTKNRSYMKYMVDLAVHMGANRTIAQRDMQDALQFERLLANITQETENRRNHERMYNKMTLADLQTRFPVMNWAAYINRIMPADLQLNPQDFLIVRELNYLTLLPQVLNAVSPRVIANYIGWRLAKSFSWHLDDMTRAIRFAYVKDVAGVKTEQERWKSCMGIVQDNFDLILGRLFVEKYFSGTSRALALDMTHRILSEFKYMISEATWMLPDDKAVALTKAQKMEERIGYPDYLWNMTKMREEYSGFVGDPQSHLNNLLTNMKAADLYNLKKLRKPVDRQKWGADPATVNAYYNLVHNTITFPAAFLQPPFFSQDYNFAMNFGGIGTVIAHEVTHAFDSEGRKYDVAGNLAVWWSNETTRHYENLTKCFVEQFHSYKYHTANLTVNGKQTLTENIADSGGVRAAYRAFKRWLSDGDNRATWRAPPGFEAYTPEQIFFIGMGQIWCGSERPESAELRLQTSFHSPEAVRVRGSLSNLPEFADVWKCKQNEDRLAPEKRCKIW